MSNPRGGAASLLWRDDEELAKKDDDLGQPGHPRPTGPWQAARVPRRRVIARFVAYALVIFILTILLNNTLRSSSEAAVSKLKPEPDFYTSDQTRPPRDQRVKQPLPPHKPASIPSPKTDTDPSSKQDGSSGQDTEQRRDFTGKLKFPDLATSLQAISATGGGIAKNRNVLFAAASLQSIAKLLPLACEMASERQNYVHFAILSRSELPVKEMLKINGIDDTCPLIVHDARPDHSAKSTERRMVVACARAFYHINLYMHPQALLIDSTDAEESYFQIGVHEQVRATGTEIIELPENTGARFSWLTKLDSTSLAAWNKVRFDILVRAPAHGSGNLQRLLRSLSRADLGAIGYPKLTIELPPAMEPSTERLLAGYRWPPSSTLSPHPPSMLSLRRRIPRSTLTEEESSARFLELFWPSEPAYSHVLVLSPNAEITPGFLSYAKYSLLHHFYSSLSSSENYKQKMMAVSLSAPTTLLDASQPITVPNAALEQGQPTQGEPPFLWQAPTSDAVLFLGERWVELHGYVSQVLERQKSLPQPPAMLEKKEVSKIYPSWLELVLQLSRLRGYFTVYSGTERARTIVGIHDDLQDKPEEYEKEASSDQAEDANGDVKQALVDGGDDAFDPTSKVNVMITLPNKGTLPAAQELPLLSWDGKETTLENLQKVAREYSQEFRREVGQCEGDLAKPPMPDKHASDLFCDIKAHT